MRKIAYLVFAAFVVVLDQLSKWFVTEHLLRVTVEGGKAHPLGFAEWYTNTPPRLPFVSEELTSFYNVVMVWNKGMSFGMLNDLGAYGPPFFLGIYLVFFSVFLVWLWKAEGRLQRLGISLVMAGIVGNGLDRVRFGAVIDFFDFHIGKWHWPAFNIADSCIVCGVFVLIIYSLLAEKSFKRGQKPLE